MKRPEPILVIELFPETRRALLDVLTALTPGEWGKPTACALWSVKDVALHLLGGDVGLLSRRRDAFTPTGKPIESYQDLVALINNLNAAWTKAARRISPRLLCDLLAFTGPQVEEFLGSLDPFAPGVPVDWAGPEPAPQWLDTAREYTERWHHQQQIRDAVGRPGLKERRFLAPVLDTFVRALPRIFSRVAAVDGTTVQLSIEGEAGGDWFLVRTKQGWELFLEPGAVQKARVVIQQDDAWRLFTKGLGPGQARRRTKIEGDAALGSKVLETVSVLA